MNHLTKDIIILICLFELFAEITGSRYGLGESWILILIPGWMIFMAVNIKNGVYKEEKKE